MFISHSKQIFSGSSGQRITVTEPDSGQKLYVDAVTPSTPNITTRDHSKKYIMAVRHTNPATMITSHIPSSTSAPTVSGATASWTGLNGAALSVARIGSDTQGFTVASLDAAAISTDTPFIGQHAVISGANTPASTAASYWTEVTAGTLANQHNHLFTMQATDSGASAPAMPSKLAGTNIEALQIAGT